MEFHVYIDEVLTVAYDNDQIRDLVIADVHLNHPEVIRTKDDEVETEIVCQKYVDSILDDGEW
jgi:hypothetical protein